MDYTQYVSPNESWNMKTVDIMREVCGIAHQDIGRRLTKSELELIKRNVQKTSPRGFQSQKKYIEHLVKTSVREISRIQLDDGVQYDIHEMQKTLMREDESQQGAGNPINQVLNTFNPRIDISGFLGVKTMRDISAIVAPQTAIKQALIVLDTRYRSTDTDGTSLFRWSLSSSIQTTTGSVNNINPIRNLVSILAYPIRIPYSTSADSYYSRISMNIVEFNSQAAIMNENGYIHFMFRQRRDGNFIELDPSYFNDGRMEFATPINAINTLTIRFANPIQTISFKEDRSNATVFQYGSETIIRTNNIHNLNTGDLVIFSDFTTANSSGDYVVIGEINTNEGVNIDVSNALPNPATDFSIDIDTSSLFAAGAGTVAVVINTKVVVGTGTAFQSFFRSGDVVVIAGNKYTIASVSSDTQMTLRTDYGGITASGLAYTKDNRVSGMQFLCYFASQRIFIPLMLSYIDANLS